MNLHEFSKLVNHTDKERQMCKYFDEHMVLYSLLADKFTDIIIDLHEDKSGCYYTLRPNTESDISYMVQFYNNTLVEFFSHKFVIEADMHLGIIYIRFIDRV